MNLFFFMSATDHSSQNMVTMVLPLCSAAFQSLNWIIQSCSQRGNYVGAHTGRYINTKNKNISWKTVGGVWCVAERVVWLKPPEIIINPLRYLVGCTNDDMQHQGVTLSGLQGWKHPGQNIWGAGCSFTVIFAGLRHLLPTGTTAFLLHFCCSF